MSTDYRTMKKVRAEELFDGPLEEFGVREHISQDETSTTRRCLTDGANYLWVNINDDGIVTTLTRYFPNGSPVHILKAICETFGTDIVSEYEPRYWGFETQEECDQAWEQTAREHKETFRSELLKYLLGEPNEFVPGVIEMAEAEIGKRLVKENPSLLLPENHDKLRNEIRAAYHRDDDVPF
jgi:hypothetical protein